ncbi:MAG: hypothetical protein AB7K24_08830, partial [Gemmataceae bacterium]
MAIHTTTAGRTGWKCLLTAALLLAIGTGAASAQEIVWRYNYNTARSLCEQKNLPLMLDIGTDNCIYC